MIASVGDTVAVDGLGMGCCRGCGCGVGLDHEGRRVRRRGHSAAVSTTAVAVVIVVAVRDPAASAADGDGLRPGNCAIVCTVVVATLERRSITVVVIVVGLTVVGHTTVTTIGVSW